ncbi:MAG: ammonium transporter [Lachnospiraceae bacterium]
MEVNDIMSAISEQVFGVWFLIGAALVFWMQAGFAMVEAGFTRAKNTGNIIMKNLMDFCIGTVMFILIGFGLFLGEDMLFGFMGKPNFDILTNYAEFDWSNFVFNLVFCATTATIVSGAMAERTKFLSYCIYSAVISAVVYPIEAHWTWGGGWLAQMGFHDFAGSNCIHMVGGIAALIGAAILGPRIGKFTKDKDGKIKVGAFPGHNLALGALGVFILWLGWYGFNGAAATSVPQLGAIFVTTTIAPAVATVVCMIFTWIKYGKPDVSMCLNASLAGLVAITAPCDVADATGAIIIGAVSGVLVVFGVWFCDYIIRVDDPVGAVAVHMMNGIWGTLAVGLFATDTAPTYSLADSTGAPMLGLFYGGGFKLLGIQAIGLLATAAWTTVTMFITFTIIKAIFGLRVTPEEEILGLDATEHGLETAYAGFLTYGDRISGAAMESDLAPFTPEDIGESITGAGVSVDDAVPVQVVENTAPVASDVKLSKVDIICKQSKFEELKAALNAAGVTGITVTQVLGCGAQKGATKYYRGVEMEMSLLPKVKVEVIVSKVPVASVVKAAKKALYTGNIGDGKIFVYDVENVIKVRTGEEGYAALQGEN